MHLQLDFQFLAQDFQIEEGGSQDFLIQNVSGSTVSASSFGQDFSWMSPVQGESPSVSPSPQKGHGKVSRKRAL